MCSTRSALTSSPSRACRRFCCPHRLLRTHYLRGDGLSLLSQLWNGNALPRLADAQRAEGEEAVIGASRVITDAPIAVGIEAQVMGARPNRTLRQEVSDKRARNPFDIRLQASAVKHVVDNERLDPVARFRSKSYLPTAANRLEVANVTCVITHSPLCFQHAQLRGNLRRDAMPMHVPEPADES